MGAWSFTVACGECGDVTDATGSVVLEEDAGNAWRLEVEFIYQSAEEGGQNGE